MTFDTPSSASRDFSMPRRPGGRTIAPVAMMQPCPGIRRGTDATVPIPPGFVRVIVAPCMSSGDSDPSRVLRIISSYTSRKPAKSIASAPLITGTINVREPSLRCTSTASPRFTCSCTMRCGLPSSSPNVWLIPGWSRTAAAIAYPIRWVNETFMSRRATFSASFSWRRRRSSVSTSRLRKLVAVGIERLSDM